MDGALGYILVAMTPVWCCMCTHLLEFTGHTAGCIDLEVMFPNPQYPSVAIQATVEFCYNAVHPFLD